MNSIKITGRMVADPELKRTQNDTAVCSFNVAVDRIYSKEKETDFFTVVAWRQTAEFVAKYFAKGRKILVEGEMQSRKYTDKEGNNRTAWEIKADRVEFCDSKGQTADLTILPPTSLPAERVAKIRLPRLQQMTMGTKTATGTISRFKERQ